MLDHHPYQDALQVQDLAGKVAVVTGASKGIGYTIALHLAKRRAGIVATSTSSAEQIERLRNDIDRIYAASTYPTPRIAHQAVSLEDPEAHSKIADALQ